METQTHSDNSQILNKVPIFAGLKDNWQALESLASMMQLKNFKADHTLIEEGQLGDEFFVLIEGQVSIYKKTPEGDTYKVAILKQEITPAIGEGGLVEAEPRSATVKTDMNCKTLVLTRDAFLGFCDQHPQWAVPILKKITLTLMNRLKQTSNDLMLLHKALMNEIRN